MHWREAEPYMLGEDGRFMSNLDDDMAIIIMLTGRLCKLYGITTIHESIC
jgi:hypothetical protein